MLKKGIFCATRLIAGSAAVFLAFHVFISGDRVAQGDLAKVFVTLFKGNFKLVAWLAYIYAGLAAISGVGVLVMGCKGLFCPFSSSSCCSSEHKNGSKKKQH